MIQSLKLQLTTPVTLLVLIGGGEFSFGETREIDAFLVRHIPSDRKTIAFLPTASGSPEYAMHLGKYFNAMDPGLATVNVPIYRGRDNRRQKNLNQILSSGMIYVGGGVTNNLLGTLRESPAEMAMRDAAANGAVIAAIGAAAACFGTHARDMHASASALPALGWLRNTVIETAFDSENDTMLRRLMSLPEVNIGIGIPPGTAVAVNGDGTASILGSGNIALFRKS